MLTPERFHELLLDYAYDLLEPADAEAVRDYLAAHPTANAQVERVRGLLATAARSEFPAVRFEAPATDLPVPQPPVVQPRGMPVQRQPRPMSRVWLRWAVAAAVLLALGAIVGPGSRHLIGYYQHKSQVEQAQLAKADADRKLQELASARRQELSEARQNVESATDELTRLYEQRGAELAEAQRKANEKHLVLVVTGPEAVQPGAPNHFQIATHNLNNVPVSARLSVRARDQSGRLLFEEKEVASRGLHSLTLPPDLPYRPNTQFVLEVSAIDEVGPGRAKVTETLDWSAPRYVTHLTTDKPMYQPGERLFLRSLSLNRATMQPPAEDFQITFTITNPQGAVIWTQTGETRLQYDGKDGQRRPILGPDGKPLRGIGAGEFLIPEGVEGGEYILGVRELSNRFPEEKRKFLVNKYKPDRLNKELEFTRKSYGPGEEVVAVCKVSQAEGGPLVGRQPRVHAQVDGKEIPCTAQGVTDATGAIRVRAQLPSLMDHGRGSLTVTFNDGGNEEAIVRSIPITLKKVFVEFFPEGGDLIAGVPNRVYFQAKTTADKPADLKARLVDSKGRTVAEQIETLHDDVEPGANQGMGAFAFEPQAGESYSLIVDEPAGVEAVGAFPAVKVDGVTLSVPTGVTGGSEPIRVELYTTPRPRNLLVGAYCRGRLLDHQRVQTEPGKKATVELKTDDALGGVVRVTAFEEKAGDGAHTVFEPRAERLVFRRTSKKVQISVQHDKSRYTPGEPVTLTVSATDEAGKPSRAVCCISVVNQSVITMADEKTFRAMPTHFAFIGEVHKPEELEHADFLLNETHPKAAAALDLLLGVQGWRRFAEQNPEEFRKQHAQEAERVLVMIGRSQTRVVTQEVQLGEIAASYEPRVKDTTEKLRSAVADKEQTAKQAGEFQQRYAGLQQNARQATESYNAALGELGPYVRVNREIRQASLPGLAVGALLLALVCLVVASVRRSARAMPYYLTAAASIGACALLVVGTIATTGDDGRSAKLARGMNPGSATSNMPAEDATALAKLNEALPQTGAEEFDRAKMLDEGEALEGKKLGEFDKAGRFGGGAGKGMPPGGLPVAPPAPPGADAKFKDDLAAAKPEREKGDKAAKGPVNQPMKPDALGAQRQLELGAEQRMARAGAEKGQLKKRIEANDRRATPPADEFSLRLELAKKRADGKDKEAQAGRLGGPDGAGGGRGMPGRGGMGLEPGMAGGGAMAAPAGLGMPGGGFRGDARFLRNAMPMQPPAAPFLVRQFYAHSVDNREAGQARNDATETVFWQPALVLPESGEQRITFALSDEITRYRVLASAHTLHGRLGSHKSEIEARKPFSVEVKLPVELTASDKLDLPVIVVNDTDSPRIAGLTIKPSNFNLIAGSKEEKLTLNANARSRRIFRLQPSVVEGVAELAVEGKTDPLTADGVTRKVNVVPEGFPVAGSVSDLLEKTAEHKLELPAEFIKGTLKFSAQIYPTTLSDLQKGLEGLLREPGGCFEQTSSSNYPNTLILQYLKESDQSNPAAAKRASEMLDRGYRMLTSFECQKSQGGREGYEWFGGAAPPHEALTAYGLLEFKDMAQVSAVDADMVQRTRSYLISRRLPDGGFQRNARALDSFGRAPGHITDAYILWSLSETGREDLTKDIDKLLKEQANSEDPYFLSLMGNTLLNVGRAKEALDVLKRVVKKQAADGGLDGAQSSITCSGGRDLRIETTALAMLAWLKANSPADFTLPLDKAVKWLGQQRGGYGGFGSTQSTILALKALIAHTKANKKTPEGGTLMLYVNGKLAGIQEFKAETTGPISIELPKAEEWLKPGTNDIRLKLDTKRSFPFTIAWSYHTLTPISDEKCAVRLTTSLSKTQVKEGDSVRLTAVLENKGGPGKGQPMTVAVIGLPSGLKVPEDMKQLKALAELKKTGPNGELEAGEISFFEIRGRELVLYWRDLKPEAKVEINLDLIANIPGEFRGAASRAYLYYNADAKCWVKPLAVQIEAQQAGE